MWAVFDTEERRIKWLFSSLERAVEIAARMNCTTYTGRYVPKRTA
jgi:hypothetical protein